MFPSPRSLRCAAAALALAAASSCGWFQSALQVHVAVDPLVRATCVQVDLFTSSDTTGEPVERRQLVRSPGKDDFVVGVFRGGLPSTVFVTARPMFGVACTELVPNGAPAVNSGTFPASGLTRVDLALDAPSDDGDGDGFVPGPNGADCDDGNPAVNPGATEHCGEVADFNCNTFIGCADPACAGMSCLASPTRLSFASAPLILAAGACSAAVQVDTTDAGGAVTAVVVPTAVSFSALDGNLTAYADAACTTPVSAVAIPAGRSRATVYLTGGTAGPARLSADAAGLTGAQQTETVVPGSVASLVFTTAAQTMAPLGGCSAPVRVELRDASGNATSAGTPLSIGLGANPSASFRFYADAACQNAAIVQTPVLAGTTTSTFYFKSTATTVGTVVVTATLGTLSATQSETLVFRVANRLVFPNLPVMVAQNVCSPAVGLETQDTMGNPAPVFTNVTIGLTSSSPSTTFYRDAACATQVTSITLTAGLSSTAFSFKGNQGTPTITANGGGLGSPQQTETITAPQPTQLAFAGAPQTVTANACSGAVSIDARDASGAATAVQSATTVTLSTNPAGQLTLYGDPACANGSITSTVMAASSSRVTVYFRGTLAAATDLTASATGLTSATQAETVTAAAATKVVIAPAGKNQSVAVGACASLTLERQDAYGNATTGALETMALISAPSTGMSFYGSAGCTSSTITSVQLPAASARVFVYFKSTSSGSYTLTETPGSSLTGDNAPETITGSSAPTELRFTSTAQNAVVAGSCSAAVTVTSTDAAGTPLAVGSTTMVGLGTTGAPGTALYSGPTCTTPITSATISTGTSSTTYYFKGTAAGPGTLTATATGLNPATPQGFTIVAAAPAKLAIIQGPFTVTAGHCSGPGSPIAVQVQDTYGNPAPVTSTITVAMAASSADTSAAYQLSFNQNCGGGGSVSSFTINTGNSTSPSLYLQTNGAGTWTITATSAPLLAGSQNETVTPDVPSRLAYLTAAQVLSTNACSAQVTAQIQDQFGNPSPPATAQSITLQGSAGFFSNPVCTNSISTGAIPVAGGQTNGSFYFKAPGTAGSYTITISITGVASPVDQVETIN